MLFIVCLRFIDTLIYMEYLTVTCKEWLSSGTEFDEVLKVT